MKFEELLGLTMASIVVNTVKDEILFTTVEGRKFKQYHCQDCCEDVSVEDVCGDLKELLGLPLVVAEERSSGGDTNYGDFEWTFYVLATLKGHVTIRWYSSSNGYYSTYVRLEEDLGI